MATIDIRIQAKEQAGRAFSKVHKHVNNLNRSMSQQRSRLRQTTVEIKQLRSSLSSLQIPLSAASNGLRVISGFTFNLTKNFISSAANMQTYRSTIQAVTRDTDETNRVMERLMNLTTELVGIDTGALIQYSARLQAAGLSAEQAEIVIRGMTKRIAEQGKSSAVTKRVLEQFVQAINTGKVSAQDFRPILREMPTLFRDASNALGVQINSIEDLRKAVQAATDPTSAFVSITQEMVRASQGADMSNLKSQLDVLKDTAEQVMAELGEHLLEVTTKLVEGINDVMLKIKELDDTEQAMISWGTTITTVFLGGAGVIGIVKRAGGAWGSLVLACGKFIRLVSGSGALLPALKTMGTLVARMAGYTNLLTTGLMLVADSSKEIGEAYMGTGKSVIEQIEEMRKNYVPPSAFEMDASYTAKEFGFTDKTFTNLSKTGQKIANVIIESLEAADLTRKNLAEALSPRRNPEDNPKEITRLQNSLKTIYERIHDFSLRLSVLQEVEKETAAAAKKSAEMKAAMHKQVGTIGKIGKAEVEKDRGRYRPLNRPPQDKAKLQDEQLKIEEKENKEKIEAIRKFWKNATPPPQMNRAPVEIVVHSDEKPPGLERSLTKWGDTVEKYKVLEREKKRQDIKDKIANREPGNRAEARPKIVQGQRSKTGDQIDKSPRTEKLKQEEREQQNLVAAKKQREKEHAEIQKLTTEQQAEERKMLLTAEERLIQQNIQSHHQMQRALVSDAASSLMELTTAGRESAGQILKNFLENSARMMVQAKIDTLFRKKLSDDMTNHEIANSKKALAAKLAALKQETAANAAASTTSTATTAASGGGGGLGFGAALLDPSGLGMIALMAATIGPPIVGAIRDGFTDTKVELDSREVGQITANAIAQQQKEGHLRVY